MKNISILVPNGAVALGTIEGPFIAFRQANNLLVETGKEPMFDIKLVGLNKERNVYDRLFTVVPDLTIADSRQSDIIIVPAVNGNMEDVIAVNEDFFPWMVKQHAAGSEIASLCVGAFLLASSGLLNGKQCSTHWLAENDFKKMFPELNLVSDKIITDEQGVYTSGGANSFWNLILYIIEKYAGREIAVYCAKIYEIELDRGTQSPFIMFTGQKEHEDEPVKKAQEFIESNYQNKITVDQLAYMLALSRRNLERRFKKATSNTVVEYMQRVKIEAAKKSLENTRKNISEVMYDVGYIDTKAFRTTFKKITGLSPIEYRGKYNKEVMVW